jgi:hypothetical protein
VKSGKGEKGSRLFKFDILCPILFIKKGANGSFFLGFTLRQDFPMVISPLLILV